MPVSRTRSAADRGRHADGDFDLAVTCELHGIRKQIEKDTQDMRRVRSRSHGRDRGVRHDRDDVRPALPARVPTTSIASRTMAIGSNGICSMAKSPCSNFAKSRISLMISRSCSQTSDDADAMAVVLVEVGIGEQLGHAERMRSAASGSRGSSRPLNSISRGCRLRRLVGGREFAPRTSCRSRVMRRVRDSCRASSG